MLSLDPTAVSSNPAATGIGVQIANDSGNKLALATVHNTDLVLRTIQSDYSIPFRVPPKVSRCK
ncbi:hypothetical protein D9M71_776700 [compost metagenome]